MRFIDFENRQNNDFLVINQFKVELTSGRGHVIPDAVLFVNGIPLVAGRSSRALASRTRSRRPSTNFCVTPTNGDEIWPTLYTENEGRRAALPHQPASHRQRLLRGSRGHRRGTAEAYLEWADTSPVPLATVAEELGMLPPIGRAG